MIKIIDEQFDTSCEEQVFEIFPDVYSDNRGWFSEVLTDNNFIKNIQQINRSCSKPGVIRGCHAQQGKNCQAKLVEAINELLFDVITDCRPESKTFGKTKIYRLDPDKQNKLFVPHGFLHAFIVPTFAQQNAYFNYYCDAKYDKASEICITPVDIVIPAMANANIPAIKNTGDFEMSPKDVNGQYFSDFKDKVLNMYSLGKIWYKG